MIGLIDPKCQATRLPFCFCFYNLLLLLHLRHTPLIAGRHKWEMNNTYELTTKLTIHGMDGNGTRYLGHLDFQWEIWDLNNFEFSRTYLRI